MYSLRLAVDQDIRELLCLPVDLMGIITECFLPVWKDLEEQGKTSRYRKGSCLETGPTLTRKTILSSLIVLGGTKNFSCSLLWHEPGIDPTTDVRTKQFPTVHDII